ncbi:MAG: bifunctional enoyl-CoA hydratase/phosphate acetyltransferase [Ignavibacteria bacterium]|nr:bifunctional enoyl-CoA hydratase/phosphate acetyltransferase [Ignavibacteria bacterium]
MTLNKLENLIQIAQQKPMKKIAVAASEDEQVLLALKQAIDEKIVEPILVGNKEKTLKIAESIQFDISRFEMVEETDTSRSARIAVKLTREGYAQIIMKGLVSTADFLRAILDKEQGLRSGQLLSHVGIFEIPSYHKLLGLTDAAQNIAPNLDEKICILLNAVDLFHRLGVENPKVAMLSAVETVNPKMQSTIDSALITMMNKRKQIRGCIIDGPLAFDNAISIEAAKHKGIESEVAGDADLLVAPDIETGNALYKSFTYFAGGIVAAVILGATAPIVLTSRSDSEMSKFMSVVLAATF